MYIVVLAAALNMWHIGAIQHKNSTFAAKSQGSARQNCKDRQTAAKSRRRARRNVEGPWQSGESRF